MKRIYNKLKVLYKYRNLLKKMVSRDLKVKYKRSALGILWSVLNPLMMMIIMTIVFSNIFKMNIENFAIYVLIGNIVFSFFSETTNQGLFSIIVNASLIKKIYLPKYLFPLSKVISCFINLLFSFIALIAVMFITNSSFHLTLLTIWVPLLYLFLFTCGLSLILSAVNVFFRDLGHLYGVVLTALMYLTPIFYSTDILPENVMKIILFNPLYHYVSFFRKIVIEGVFPSVEANVICILFSVITLFLGIYVFKKSQDKFILYI